MDKPTLGLNNSRRAFLFGAAAAIAMNVAESSQTRLGKAAFASPLGNDGLVSKPDVDGQHLTVDYAKHIAAHFQEDDFLDLKAFSTASLDALGVLARLPFAFAELGFRRLDSSVAAVLGSWDSFTLSFPRITRLTAEVVAPEVVALLNPRDQTLDFPFVTDLDVDTAKALVDYTNGKTSGLSLGERMELKPSVAAVLADHQDDLYLRLSHLSPEAAAALASHRGYKLDVVFTSADPSESIQAFFAIGSTSMKCAEYSGPFQDHDGLTRWSLKLEATPAWWETRYPLLHAE